MTSLLQGQVKSSRHSRIHLTPLVCIQDVQMNATIKASALSLVTQQQYCSEDSESTVSAQYSEKNEQLKYEINTFHT